MYADSSGGILGLRWVAFEGCGTRAEVTCVADVDAEVEVVEELGDASEHRVKDTEHSHFR